jgi:hypothetical protein
MTTPPKDAPVTTETHRDDPREWLARRISEFKDAPVTEAGRFLLAWDHNGAPMPPDVFRDSIKRIETEAATAARSDEIDAGLTSRGTVEDVAVAMHAGRITGCAFTGDKQACSSADHIPDAESYLRERRARIRSEQGERTPRVDSEIDAT